jgi:hypothetical protein
MWGQKTDSTGRPPLQARVPSLAAVLPLPVIGHKRCRLSTLTPPQASRVSHTHASRVVALTRDSPCLQHTSMPHCWPAMWTVPRGVQASQAPNDLLHLGFVQCCAYHDRATACTHGKHRPHFARTQYVLAWCSTTAATFGANRRA